MYDTMQPPRERQLNIAHLVRVQQQAGAATDEKKHESHEQELLRLKQQALQLQQNLDGSLVPPEIKPDPVSMALEEQKKKVAELQR